MRVRRARKDRDTGRNRRRRCAGALVVTLCVVLLLLTTGCTERDALPTGPTIGVDAGPWRLIHQSITGYFLYAAWGMDADDMWAVGSQGLILHHDGRATRFHPKLTNRWLQAIDGAARDAVWTVSSDGEIFHWNGRTWQFVWRNFGRLNTVCALAPDDVYVGGVNRGASPQTAGILRFDGRRWVDMDFAEDPPPFDEIIKIWRPANDWPLLAGAIPSGLIYRLEAGIWHVLTEQLFFAVYGDLLLAIDPSSGYLVSLKRLRADGSLELLCAGSELHHARHLVSSRRTALGYSGYSGQVARLDDCLPTPLWDTGFSVQDLTRPILAGEQGHHLFVVGGSNSAEFHRLTWRDDLTLQVTSLLEPAQRHWPRQVAVGGTGIVSCDDQGNIWHRRDGTWRQLATPIDVSLLLELSDGSLAIGNPDQIAVWHPDGSWTPLPPSPYPVRSWWIDHQLRPRTILQHPVTQHLELWALDEVGWQRLETLSEQFAITRGPAGFAPDDLYVRVGHELLHHDGEALQSVPATDGRSIDALLAGHHTGRLYLKGWDEEDVFFTGYLHEDQLTVQTLGHGWAQLHEVSADLTVCLAGTPLVLQRWTDTGWVPMAGPTVGLLQAVSGHPDHGLVVITADGAIHQRSLPESVR